MKRESRPRGFGASATAAPEAVAVQVLDRLVADPERLGRFLALTGLDPATIRRAASGPGFLPAVLDHVTADEALLLAVGRETGLGPDAIADAQRRLSPVIDGGA